MNDPIATAAPVLERPMTEPPTLEYANTQMLGLPQARGAFRLMLFVAILSGLCVGACFLSFTDNVAAHALHTLIFIVTIFLAIQGGRRLARASSGVSFGPMIVLDALALCGLAIIGAAPIAYQMTRGMSDLEELGAGILGAAYALLALTTARHVMLYKALAEMCRQINRRGLARNLTVLGWFKAIYECLWLGSCAITLMVLAAKNVLGTADAEGMAVATAMAGLFGCLGYGAIWIWMIVAHAQLLRVAK